MYLKVLKTIYVRYEWFPVIISVFFSKYKLYFLFSLIMCFLHEMCHLMTAYFVKIKVKYIVVHIFGFEIGVGRGTYIKDLLVAAAGPAGSALFLCVGVLLGSDVLVNVNLMLLAVNLLPVLPLDGGRILKTLLLKRRGCAKTKKIMQKSAIVCGALLCFAAIVLKSVWSFMVSLVVLSYIKHISGDISFIPKCKGNIPFKTVEVENIEALHKAAGHFSPYYKTVIKTGKNIYISEDVWWLLVAKEK